MAELIESGGREAPSGQLNSWKEIAAYLGREMRTIQRWEKEEGLPVHRHLHSKRSSVYAFESELDAWWYGRSVQPDAAAGASGPVVESNGTNSRRPRVWLAAAIGLAVVSAPWFYWGRHGKEGSPTAAIPLTSYPGRELSPAFSPDGSQIAFAWNGQEGQNFDIYVKQTGSYTPHRLSNHSKNEYNPTWSPDGRLIAFLRDLDDGRAAVILIPSRGGQEVKLTEAASAPRGFSAGKDVPLNSLGWSPDGKWLVISDRSAANEPLSIVAVSIGNGERRKLTSPAAPSLGDFSAVFSPDGSRIAFSRSKVLLVSDIYVLSMSKRLEAIGEPRRLTYNSQWNVAPAWTPAGDEIVYSSGDLSFQQLYRVNTVGRSNPRRLASIGANGSTPAFGPRGTSLAYVRISIDCDIYSVPTVQQVNGTARPMRVISATSAEGNVDYSPDGNRIAYFSDRSGMGEVWTSERDGSNPTQFTFFGELRAGTPRWSPDGKLIVFDSRSDGSGDIWVSSVEAKSPPLRLTTNPASDLVPNWSRNGQWIYFASNRTGEFQVWKMPRGGEPAVQVTQLGGGYAIESPDGSTLYYAKSIVANGSSGTSVWRVPVAGGDETKVLDSVQSWANFSVTGKGIYFTPTGQTAAHPVIEFYGFGDGKRQVIARLEKPSCIGLSVSPDGKSVLYSQVEQDGSDLMLVENFR